MIRPISRLCLALTSLALLAAPVHAATDSFTVDATVAANAAVTATSTGSTAIDFDIGVGSLRVVSNSPNGFTIAIRNANPGSHLQHTVLSAGDPGEQINYSVYMSAEFGTLGAAEPAGGPFSPANAVALTNLFTDNTFSFLNPVSATDHTWGVRASITAFDHAYAGTFQDTIFFEVLDL